MTGDRGAGQYLLQRFLRLHSQRHSSAPHAALQAEADWRIHDFVALGNAFGIAAAMAGNDIERNGDEGTAS